MQFLDKASREVQTEGWKFNTQSEYSLPIDSGYINLAENVVVVRLSPLRYPTSSYDVTIRGNRLFNNVGATFVFTDTLTAEAIILLEWDDLPEHVRSYVMLKARREFQSDMQGSDSATSTQSRDELQAFFKMKRIEGWQSNVTFIDRLVNGRG
jgi:hypothetical protein